MDNKNELNDQPKSEEVVSKVEDVEKNDLDNNDDDENLDEDTEIVTMVDVLNEETELEDNAHAGENHLMLFIFNFNLLLFTFLLIVSNSVLGGSDDSQCTYRDEKAFRRQALYACKTCADETGIWQAGICLACSYVCHDKHELFELYTKRAFKCDCGLTSKFPGKKCSLISDKSDEENATNIYNQNFKGKYCTCERPYPDPEDHEEDQMIQCISCEDWFHGRHLVGHMPDNDDFSEMVCHKCMSKLSFLWNYYERDTATKRVKRENDSSATKDEKTTGDNVSNGKESENGETIKTETKTETSTENSTSVTKVENGTSTKCILKEKKEANLPSDSVKSGSTFWDENWRTILCQCNECVDLYKQLDCSYLIDTKDTVHYYESENRQQDARCSSTSSMERGMEAFGHMPRPQQIEMLHSYNDLQTALKDYLKTFADENKVVTKEDINKFFEEFKSKSSRASSQLLSSCR